MRIIYVDVDSLRADHCEPYGYGRKITPNLKEFARRSVVFDRYYCSDAPCLPSRAALTSGQFGITNGVVGHFGEAAKFRLPDSEIRAGHAMQSLTRPLLGDYLGDHGLYAASVSCFAERHLAYWFYGNFRESIRPSKSLGQDEDALNVNAAAFRWLDQHGKQDNWFLHVNYWEPHTAYIEPIEWFEKAGATGPVPDWPDEETIGRHKAMYGPHTARDLTYLEGGRSVRPEVFPEQIGNRADLEKLVNGYDGEVMYWDHHFGQLLDKLGDLKILDDTAIIVSADHGEALGEGGTYAEHGLANDAVNRIPLVVYWPGVTTSLSERQRRCDAMLCNIDLAPTLCDLLHVDPPPGWQGTSFAPAILGESIPGRPFLALSQGAHTFQRAVRTRDHLYIRTLHSGCYSMPPEEMYRVADDPHMLHDVLSAEPRRADELRSLLDQWWHQYAGFPGALPDPMQAALVEGPSLYAKPAQYANHLDEVGRHREAKALRRRVGLAG